ncbi:MAG TPA: PQQ-dependent sugar dehydrogenase [Gaiellaceae bacterium]|jgi:glucose/arabinose dehydrogenase|nr:PQQ-dependent sugar dehydrogenase [Gaiellaceae bacterium]
MRIVGLVALFVLALATGGCAGDEESARTTTAARPPAESEPETTTGETTAATTEEAPAEPVPGRGRGLHLVEVASGLEAPTHAAAAPGEPERLYVVERPGRIRVVERGRVLPRLFLDIAADVTSGGEQGLLSVAFHPEYERNRRFYVDYTDLGGDTRVVEFRARGAAQPQRVRELLFVEQPYANHNGGQLAFGPDGLLYVGMGDGGSAGDPENRAQDLDSRLGKLLRLDVDRRGAEWETAAYGLRNPWRFSFDRETEDLFVADVGQGEWEEIDHLPAGERRLVNFGWDVLEGTHPFEEKEPSAAGRLVGPVLEYDHSFGCSVTGGHVYRGEDLAEAYGRYFYGDYCSGIVWSFVLEDGRVTSQRRHPFEVASLSSFGEDGRGGLLLLSLEGTIYRLTARP